MKYWWVNHRQTHKEEIKGGYIWSPTRNKNNSINQTYINLTKTSPKDIIYSFAFGKIMAIGIVEKNCIDSNIPAEFGIKGSNWTRNGWLVNVNWTLLNSPIDPKRYINKVAPLLPDKYSPIQKNGHGNQGCYLAAISEPLGSLLLRICIENNNEIKDEFNAQASSINEKSLKINEPYLPTLDDFLTAYSMLAELEESVSISRILDQIYKNLSSKGLQLKSNWRIITDRNIKELWVNQV